jgi:hypothetical protein
MADLKAAWNDASARLSELAMELKLHYERQRGADGDQERGDSDRARSEVESAAKRVTEAVRDVFEAIGAAAKDPAVKDDVKHVGQSLTDALNATFAEVSADMRKAFSRPTGAPVAETPANADPRTAEAAPSPPGPAEQKPLGTDRSLEEDGEPLRQRSDDTDGRS